MRVDNYCACSCGNYKPSNEPVLTKPLFHKGDLTQRKKISEPIRVYHRKLRTDNLINIYGVDTVDNSMGNVREISVCPLTANQEEMLSITNNSIYHYEEEY